MIELLAPAGDISALKTAIASGTDAVYLGLSAFNARIKAQNFNGDNIADVVKYCHIFGVRVYVTVNISIKHNEIEDVENLISLCKRADVDAFIICDFAVLDIVRRIAPEIPLHASTQLGICNAEGAKFAESCGFTRVVLSREATLEEIKKIRAETNLEIECFVQGALCVAFSGKCLMSSITNGGSGNRGRCLQPCRLKYTEKGGKSGYLLSTSDLCLVNRLSELNAAGVTSFKIEGRLRRNEYVAKTVSVYRKVIDNNFAVEKSDIEILKSAFNRGGFSEGYAFSDTDKIMSIRTQGNIGVRAGRIVSVKNGFITIGNKFEFVIGQGYKLFDSHNNESGGGRIEKIERGCPKIAGAEPGYYINITDGADNAAVYKKHNVNCDAVISDEGIMYVKYTLADDPSVFAEVKSEIKFDIAENPDDKIIERIEKSLVKCGDNDYFNIIKCGVLSSLNFYTPLSALNALRRAALSKLSDVVLKKYKKRVSLAKFPEIIIKKTVKESNLIAVEINDAKMLNALSDIADIAVYNPDVLTVEGAKEFCNQSKGKEIYLKTLPNAREKDIELYRTVLKNTSFTGVYADNLYAVTLAKEHNLAVFGGQGLNIYNNKIFGYAALDKYMVSPELNAREASAFNSPFVFAYGYLPLMNLSHCVTKLISGGDCANCRYKKPYVYTDRAGYSFPVRRNKAAYCYFTVYNSKITDISQKYLNCGFNYYLNMVQCETKDAALIAKRIKCGQPAGTVDFTYGHMSRGVK